MLTVNFTTSNAAFQGEGGKFEIARILKEVSNEVESGWTAGPLYDCNGNKVGTYTLSESN